MERNRIESIADKGHQRTERREFPRASGELEFRYVVVSGKDRNVFSKSRHAQMEDLAAGGLSFKTKELIADGLHISTDTTSKGFVRNRLILQFQLPGLSYNIKASGEVVWYQVAERGDEPTYAVGVRFIGIKPEDREAIRRYVSKILG